MAEPRPFADYYRGRRVLVTGHTGFKGSWLTLWLRELGAEVTGYALPPDTEPSLFELADVGKVCTHVVGDLRDSGAVAAAMQQAQPEMVFHLAAQPLVRRSYRDPKETFDVNVGGTVNVLEAMRHTASVHTAVLITTDKVYENREWLHGYREPDALGGRDPYSASKAAAEIAIAAYRDSFFAEAAQGRRVGVASTRAGNVIGGGDWAEDRILPDAVRAALAGNALEVRNPASIRPWQHVLEPLAAYLALGVRLAQQPAAYEGAWNFGPASHDVVTVRELVDCFVHELGRGTWRDVSAAQHGAPHEAGLLKLACDKAHAKLAWRPVLETRAAVQLAAAWYRDVLFDKQQAGARCRQDIGLFLKQAAESQQWWAQ